MAEEKPSLHIDTDWKRQAQEEKKRLAEQEAKKAAAAPPAAAVPTSPIPANVPGAARVPGRAQAGMPDPSFPTLVQSLMTQALFYLGDLSARGAEPNINLDMAKHQIDTLKVLEDKTNGNLSEDEKHVLDAALYETRMRFVNVASQFIS